MLIVYCQTRDNFWDSPSEDFLVTYSPLTCLSLAATKKPEAIFMDLPFGSLDLNSKQLELVDCLKRDTRIRQIPLFVLLSSPQKVLLEKLDSSKSLRVILCNTSAITPSDICEFINNPGPSYFPGYLASIICPFINYEPFKEDEEIALCGADKNRLVLNQKRLHKYCNNREHLNCPFFLHPIPGDDDKLSVCCKNYQRQNNNAE